MRLEGRRGEVRLACQLCGQKEMEHGAWRMKNGEWRAESGGRRMGRLENAECEPALATGGAEHPTAQGHGQWHALCAEAGGKARHERTASTGPLSQGTQAQASMSTAVRACAPHMPRLQQSHPRLCPVATSPPVQ